MLAPENGADQTIAASLIGVRLADRTDRPNQRPTDRPHMRFNLKMRQRRRRRAIDTSVGHLWAHRSPHRTGTAWIWSQTISNRNCALNVHPPNTNTPTPSGRRPGSYLMSTHAECLLGRSFEINTCERHPFTLAPERAGALCTTATSCRRLASFVYGAPAWLGLRLRVARRHRSPTNDTRACAGVWNVSFSLGPRRLARELSWFGCGNREEGSMETSKSLCPHNSWTWCAFNIQRTNSLDCWSCVRNVSAGNTGYYIKSRSRKWLVYAMFMGAVSFTV